MRPLHKLTFLIIALVLALGASAAIQGPDNRIAYTDLEKFDVKELAAATATQINTRFLNLDESTGKGSYPSGRLQNLCPGEKFEDLRTMGACSGFLVAPDILVTAGHCNSEYRKNNCEGEAWVFRYYQSPQDGQVQLESDQVVNCQEVLDFHHDQEGDFAVLRLAKEVSGVTPLSIDLRDRVELNDPVAVLGYPEGLPFTYSPGGRVKRIDQNYLQADVDSFKNNSGSPIVNQRTGYVEGVLTNSRNGFEFDSIDGCRLARSHPQDSEATLINRLRRIPYFQSRMNFVDKLISYEIKSHCAETVNVTVKHRNSENKTWETVTGTIAPGESFEPVRTKHLPIYLHAVTQAGGVVKRGQDFFGFRSEERQEELGFVRVGVDERQVSLCQ